MSERYFSNFSKGWLIDWLILYPFEKARLIGFEVRRKQGMIRNLSR